ncbi:Peptidoglycan O-acetyltransferase [Enhygromyxa salina]|uniref:Peptidoglycan O-acetyltransferase n=1 Tax=Enhygromyxa salina TaxID=215803 RepID=A0A2S9YBF3_9BACT|nr:MBOAT family O-acyltransferase [Enhygromyxa salina]PRQ02433.1 Peptidoglycan O-acetyltransferase [Enhygromyxa salina]
MTFTTLTFLLFLALVFALYWTVRGRVGQNAVVVGASYVFYGWWDLRFCALILASSLVDFAIARALARGGPRARRRALVAVSCTLNLGLLALFKYFDFFIDSFAVVLASFGLSPNLPSLHLLLPVGISFYTFQTLGYTIDVYREDAKASDSLLDYLAYVAFFPQLVAGPIERARRLLPQLQTARSFDEAAARDGAKLILWGFCKKIILADHLGEFVELIYGAELVHASGPVLALATICFAFQIYCDFSAYSDIAIGTAKLFGVRLVRNFAHPYFSQSVTEFWRRWHMSLSTWFRDYVYVPLGGSRRGPARLWLSLMVTFTLSGLWHGASWTFVIWGAVNGLLVGLSVAIGRAPRRGPDDLPASLTTRAGLIAAPRMLATFALICLTWVFFRAQDLAQAMGILARIVTDLPRAAAWTELVHHREFLLAFGPLLLIFVIVEWLTRDQDHPLTLAAWPRAARWLLYTALIWITIYLMPDDPGAFIYFQF